MSNNDYIFHEYVDIDGFFDKSIHFPSHYLQTLKLNWPATTEKDVTQLAKSAIATLIASMTDLTRKTAPVKGM